MRTNLLLFTILSLFFTSCSSKAQPKVCNVVIAEPSKAELEKFQKVNRFGKK